MSQSKDNPCKNSVCTCTPNCKCINCSCGTASSGKECAKQSGSSCFAKNRKNIFTLFYQSLLLLSSVTFAGEGTSFTELLKTPNAAVQYIVHSSEDGKGLPDIELSVCKDGKDCVAAVPVNCGGGGGGKVAGNGVGCCAKNTGGGGGGSSTSSGIVKNAGAKATPSEIADIAKLIKEHERDNEELKKMKEGKACGGGGGACGGGGGRAASSESMKETVQSQLQKWKMKGGTQEKKAAEAAPPGPVAKK